MQRMCSDTNVTISVLSFIAKILLSVEDEIPWKAIANSDDRKLKIIPQKVCLMLMTSFVMTSHRDVEDDHLYSCLNEIGTFSANQVEVFQQSVPKLVNLRSSVLRRSL